MHDTCIIFSRCIYVIFCHFNIIYKYIIVTLYNNSQINILACLAISSHRIYIITSASKFVIIPRKYKLECLRSLLCFQPPFNKSTESIEFYSVQAFTKGLSHAAALELAASIHVRYSCNNTHGIVHRRVNKLNCTF